MCQTPSGVVTARSCSRSGHRGHHLVDGAAAAVEQEDRLVVGVEHVDVDGPFLFLVGPGVLVHPDHAGRVVVDAGQAHDPRLGAGALRAAGNLLAVDPQGRPLLPDENPAADELVQRLAPVLVLLPWYRGLLEPRVGVRPGHPQEAVRSRQHRRPCLLLVDDVVGRGGDPGGQLGQRSQRGERSQHGHGGHRGRTAAGAVGTGSEAVQARRDGVAAGAGTCVGA